MRARSRIAGLFLLSALAAGCGAEVRRDGAAAPGQVATVRQIASVRLDYSEAMRAKLGPGLDAERAMLLARIDAALRARSLLPAPGAAPAADAATLDIVITDIRIRSTASAVLFGILAGDDHVVGDVALKDAAGRPVNRFMIDAKYAWGGIAGGHETRMGWLYDQFADLTAKEVGGG